jgi:hypothetical protein
MQKISNLIIILFLVFTLGKTNLASADPIENILNMWVQSEEITLKLYSLENPRLNDKKNQKQYFKINKLNNKIKIALIKKYQNNWFGYYQMQWIIKNYNNFIYYTNKYFKELKNKELYWNTKEIESNIYNNFTYMKSYYSKFQNLIKQKNTED